MNQSLDQAGSDERPRRALTAFLGQKVQAPASAVTGFLDMIIEGACGSQPDKLLADLNCPRGASVQLNVFVKSRVSIGHASISYARP